MLIAYSISASSLIIRWFNPEWNFVTTAIIPYEIIGWFWAAIASVYVGGTSLLNIFTSRNLHDLSSVEASAPSLLKVSYMNYIACVYCFFLVLIGVNIPLEAIFAAAGACTILAVAGKKVAGTAIQQEAHIEEEEIAELEKKIYERKISGEKDGSGKDEVLEDLEKKLQKKRKENTSIKS